MKNGKKPRAARSKAVEVDAAPRVVTTIRMLPELLQQIDAEASKEGRTRGAWIERVILERFKPTEKARSR